MINAVFIKCPSCHANLNVDIARGFVFCEYCGTKILLHDDNVHTYRYVDVASLKRAETEQALQEKKAEAKERRRQAVEKRKKTANKIALYMLVIGGVCVAIGFIPGIAVMQAIGFIALFIAFILWLVGRGELDFGENGDLDDMARVPDAVADIKDKNYKVIEAAMKSSGFEDVTCVAMDDLVLGLLKKPGTVESLSINGREFVSPGRKYPKDAKVVITYHSLPDKRS